MKKIIGILILYMPLFLIISIPVGREHGILYGIGAGILVFVGIVLFGVLTAIGIILVRSD